MTNVDTMLTERNGRYGSFDSHATASQGLKHVFFAKRLRSAYKTYQAEALEMIMHKLARIANGDPDYADNWVDIAGYATLVVKELEKLKKE